MRAKRFEIEVHRRSVWLRVGTLFQVWAEVRPGGFGMWGVWREGGELEVRAGRILVYLTPRKVILRDRRAATAWASEVA